MPEAGTCIAGKALISARSWGVAAIEDWNASLDRIRELHATHDIDRLLAGPDMPREQGFPKRPPSMAVYLPDIRIGTTSVSMTGGWRLALKWSMPGHG